MGVTIYAVLMVFAVLGNVLADEVRVSPKKSRSDEKRKGFFYTAVSYAREHGITAADVCMALFVLANVLAFLVAADKNAAYTGALGRRCGLQFVVIAMFMYICLRQGCRVRGFELSVFMLAGIFTCVVAVLQFMGNDFLGLREGVSPSIKDKYISTLGNIDIYASFLCVLMPAAMATVLCDSKGRGHAPRRVLAGLTLCAGAAAMVINNADLAYAGVGAAFVLLTIVAFYMGRLRELALSAVCMTSGFVFINLVLNVSVTGFDNLVGISRFAGSRHGVWLAWGTSALVYIIISLAQSKRRLGISGGRAAVVAAACMAVAAIAGLAAAGLHGSNLLTFNDAWGNYRGYVWSRLVEIYKELPPYKWLLGNGNESVKALMTADYHDEMIKVTGFVYDNAHNEYLQYLVTTGIFGALSYIGLIVCSVHSSLRFCMRKPDGDEQDQVYITRTMCLALALGMMGYAVQALFNVNQPLTTPYMFFMLSLAAGVCRHAVDAE